MEETTEAGSQEELLRPRKKKTIIDIINHKILFIIIVCSTIFVIIYVIVENIQVSLPLILILIDLYAAMIIAYYDTFYLKYKFYPKFLEHVNLPPEKKIEFDKTLYGKKSIYLVIMTLPILLYLGLIS